jgi:hypothetical protein
VVVEKGRDRKDNLKQGASVSIPDFPEARASETATGGMLKRKIKVLIVSELLDLGHGIPFKKNFVKSQSVFLI